MICFEFTPGGRSELVAYCPFCGSTASPPLTINLKDGGWYCRNCGRSGGPLELLSGALLGKEAALRRVIKDFVRKPEEQFLLLHFQEAPEEAVPCSVVYDSYRCWALESGYQPKDMRQFGRELRKVFRVERRRGPKGPSGKREWLYRGIRPSPGPTQEGTGRALPC